MKPSPPEIVLASGSPYRAELLRRLRLPFQVAIPGIDESPDTQEAPPAWAERLAMRKAQAVCRQFPNALVIGSDQVAECRGQLIGKPGSEAAAIAQLLSFSGAVVQFHTGLALVGMAAGFAQSTVETVRVQFRELDRDEIAHYVRLDKPLDCAGSFKCEGLGISLFSRIDSRDPSALIGLPLIRLCSMLRKAGVALPSVASDSVDLSSQQK